LYEMKKKESPSMQMLDEKKKKKPHWVSHTAKTSKNKWPNQGGGKNNTQLIQFAMRGGEKTLLMNHISIMGVGNSKQKLWNIFQEL